jgi:hypothetical protein
METNNPFPGRGSLLVIRLREFLGLNLVWLLLALLTAWIGWRSYTLSSNGNVVQGKVVKLLQDSIAFYSDFTPIVEFQVEGVTYRVQSQNSYRWWSRYVRFPVDGQVHVRYEAGNPEHAEINSWWDLWNETILLGVLTIFAAFAINVYLLGRWRSQRIANRALRRKK